MLLHQEIAYLQSSYSKYLESANLHQGQIVIWIAFWGNIFYGLKKMSPFNLQYPLVGRG